MKAKARILGHAVHPILVTAPIGLGLGVVALDVLSYLRPWSDAWPKGSYALLGLAVLSGLGAALFGFIDWLGIPAGTRAKRIGLFHAASNVFSLSLLAVSFALRGAELRQTSLAAVIVSTIGVLLFALGGWLGGELVQRLGMSVDPDANPNAPSSLGRGSSVEEVPPSSEAAIATGTPGIRAGSGS